MTLNSLRLLILVTVTGVVASALALAAHPPKPVQAGRGALQAHAAEPAPGEDARAGEDILAASAQSEPRRTRVAFNP